MIATKNQVKDLIPQKFPFVMVDELLSYSEESLTSRLVVSPENIFFYQDNFIEAGIIEHMAQSVALHTGYQFFLLNKEAPTGYIGSIKNIQINRLPSKDEILETKVAILQEFMGITLVDITIYIDGVSIASCQMKTVIANS